MFLGEEFAPYLPKVVLALINSLERDEHGECDLCESHFFVLILSGDTDEPPAVSFSEAAQLFSAGASASTPITVESCDLLTSTTRSCSTRRTYSRSTQLSQSKGDCARHARKRRPPLSCHSWNSQRLNSSDCRHTTPRTCARADWKVGLGRGHHLGREGGHQPILLTALG